LISSDAQVQLCSSIPGRERWEIEGLIRENGLAEALENALLTEHGVISVRANPSTGRVLIRFQTDHKLSCGRLIRIHLRAILSRPNSQPQQKPAGNPLIRILKSTPQVRRQAAIALSLSIAGQIVNVARRVLLISTINVALSSAGVTPAAAVAGAGIPAMTGWLVVLVAASSFLDHFTTVAWAKLARSTEEAIRGPLLVHVQHLDVAFFEREGTGRLMNLVVGDITTIGRFIEAVGDELVEAVISITWAGGMLLWIAPSLFGLSLVPIPFVMLAAKGIGPLVNRRTAAASNSARTFSQRLGNSLAGIIDVKNFTAEQAEAERLQADGKAVDATSVSAESASSIQYQAIQGIFGAGFSTAIGFAGSLVLSGEVLPNRTLHVLYWFPNLMSSLARLQSVLRHYHSAVRASENVMRIMETQPQIVSGPLRLSSSFASGEIAFERVSFAYDPGMKVLDDVSFTVMPGQMLAIVGPTGSGKSTLIRLLLRHYDVLAGSISLNGRDIRELNLQDLRRAIGVVGQDVYLFEGTVKDNVLYGLPASSPAQLDAALESSGASAFLSDLPHGVNSDVGERGKRLSGGQRQRVAIARALLKNAPVLALDEATSHLDYETEGMVQRSVRRASGGRTMIVVAHRLSTIRRADEIIVLESGRICERGTHDELIRRGGLYASLWLLQNGSSDMQAN
jgi:ATP-binding cassette subfamily B protein